MTASYRSSSSALATASAASRWAMSVPTAERQLLGLDDREALDEVSAPKLGSRVGDLARDATRTGCRSPMTRTHTPPRPSWLTTRPRYSVGDTTSVKGKPSPVPSTRPSNRHFRDTVAVSALPGGGPRRPPRMALDCSLSCASGHPPGGSGSVVSRRVNSDWQRQRRA